MPTLLETIRDRFDETQGRMRGIEDAAAADNRDELTEPEQATWDELNAQAQRYAERLEILTQREQLDQRASAALALITRARPAEPAAGEPGQPPTYESAGAYALDYMRMGHGDPQARARLTRVVANTLTADTPGLVPPQVTGGLLFALNEQRPTVNSFSKPALPATGMKVQRPNVTQHTNVQQQATEKTEVISATFQVNLLEATLQTWAGQADVSWQLAERSSPGAIDLIFSDLVGMYARNSNGQAASLFVGGIPPGGTWDGTGPGLVPALSDAAVTIAGTSHDRIMPTTVWMGLDVFGQITGLVDADGRPLLPNIGPTNAVGTADATSIGNLRGLNVVVDAAPAMNGHLIVGHPRYAEWYETAGAPVRLSVTEVSILGYNIGVAGMFAFLLTDPGAFVDLAVTITAAASTSRQRSSSSSSSKA
jgi:HK97 family phage major capsid protein